MFGRLLEWLNDHQTDVFFACTCNDISKIVETNPEFVRAGRFDGMFFFDCPGPEERRTIWEIYLRRYKHKEDSYDLDELVAASGKWTGAEIESCCRLSAILKDPLMVTADTVVPVAKTAASTLESLKQWASGRCRCARRNGLYRIRESGGRKASTTVKTGRRRRTVDRNG